MTEVAFCPCLSLGVLDVLDSDGSPIRGILLIPAWLVDRPDVLAALAVIAARGGTRYLAAAPDWHDVVVDIEAKTAAFRDPA